MLGFLLRRLGYTVIEASDGKEALRLAVDTQPDLIVTDWDSPQWTVLILVRHVRTNNRHNREFKIVILSDATLFSPKPVDLEKLENIWSLRTCRQVSAPRLTLRNFSIFWPAP